MTSLLESIRSLVHSALTQVVSLPTRNGYTSTPAMSVIGSSPDVSPTNRDPPSLDLLPPKRPLELAGSASANKRQKTDTSASQDPSDPTSRAVSVASFATMAGVSDAAVESSVGLAISS